MFNWGSAKEIKGYNIFPDDSASIDMVLDPVFVRKIYDGWDSERYGAPMDYGGGVRAITAKMVVDAGRDFLVSLQGIGEVRADEIMEKLKDDLRKVPYI